ncbi:hypothetical protein AUEXF2481DRAFT_38195 [Aureobasidium subglaciale EXF-2481]|uniref:Uncharacterized protein n=1 Tax=Aureobasidium subglaciale (strain EXF-2481) TaxID=1043005 RepID=A0A074YRQ2_AURSE|nr:uncharacterized protein AUEXF2481DRAFT_38195 [Aureobasidium subglaciale EXF-2481]KEQ96782.1 hypothetical protein AUEXF2481DRAFT_38195 [Aureobasidium subglaciale EXF-2481]
MCRKVIQYELNTEPRLCACSWLMAGADSGALFVQTLCLIAAYSTFLESPPGAGYAEALVAAMSGVLPMTYLYGFPQLPSSTASCALRFLLGEVAWK